MFVTAKAAGGSLPSTPQAAAPAAAGRVELVDLLRGFALAILVLEASRQYFHGALYRFDPLDLTQTTPAIFATRWATHLSAPILALLAGVSAWLRSTSGAGTPQLSRYLLTRGLWLILLELTLVTFGRNFTLPPPILLQALASVGAAMAALAVLVWLPRRIVLGLGIAALLVTDLLDRVHSWNFGPLGIVWNLLHEPLFIVRDNRLVAIADYSLIPWVAIAMVGYGLGPTFAVDSKRRDRVLFGLGAAMIGLFVFLRATNTYGDPNPWLPQDDAVWTVMSFLNVAKFPPSLLFVCITLGIALVSAPLLMWIRGPVADLLRAFGRAPLLTYVVHFYLVHALALITLLATGADLSPTFDAIGKYAASPQAFIGAGYDLPIVYLAWAVSLGLLYPLSRWWADRKHRGREWWLSYL